jgi:hypothetical protein
MDQIIEFVTSGRIFKQVAEYAWTRRATETLTPLQSRDPSIFEDAEDCTLHRTAGKDGLRPMDLAGSNFPPADEETLSPQDSVAVEQDTADLRRSNSPPHTKAVNYAEPTEKLPLTARYPELLTFIGKEDELGTGVALTKAMVWQFNSIFQGEQKIAERVSNIQYFTEKRETIEGFITETGDKLNNLPQYYQSDPDPLHAALQDQEELEELVQCREELNLEIESLEGDIQKIQEDVQWATNRILSTWKETLAEGGLLEPLTEEVETQIPDSNAHNTAIEAQPESSPTPSEAERYAVADARDAALHDITQKIIQVQDAQERFDNLVNHYNKEYDAFVAGVEAGTISALKSDFDRVMLLDSREATTMLIQAEEALEQARDHARGLGLTLSSYDQESCFVDYLDDGYRESLENEWAAHVDRGRIERWMDSEVETPEEIECDEWDSRTVDISDSVSAVADTPKSRRRIDHWRSICESLAVEMTEQANTDCEMTDF